MATGHGLHGLLEVGIHGGIVQDGLGVHADVVVDDELQAGQAHALVGQLGEVEGQLGLPTFIMILVLMAGISPRCTSVTSVSIRPS